jgi:hypothetical protein
MIHLYLNWLAVLEIKYKNWCWSFWVFTVPIQTETNLWDNPILAKPICWKCYFRPSKYCCDQIVIKSVGVADHHSGPGFGVWFQIRSKTSTRGRQRRSIPVAEPVEGGLCDAAVGVPAKEGARRWVWRWVAGAQSKHRRRRNRAQGDARHEVQKIAGKINDVNGRGCHAGPNKIANETAVVSWSRTHCANDSPPDAAKKLLKLPSRSNPRRPHNSSAAAHGSVFQPHRPFLSGRRPNSVSASPPFHFSPAEDLHSV